MMTLDTPDDSAAFAVPDTVPFITAPRVEAPKRPYKISRELFGATAAVGALTAKIHIVTGIAATLLRFAATIETAATGSDRTVSIDLQRAPAGSSTYTSVLSAPVALPSTWAANKIALAPFVTTDLVLGDSLRVVVATSGSLGAQQLGLFVECLVEESDCTWPPLVK
jgi:hypothetical protein